MSKYSKRLEGMTKPEVEIVYVIELLSANFAERLSPVIIEAIRGGPDNGLQAHKERLAAIHAALAKVVAWIIVDFSADAEGDETIVKSFTDYLTECVDDYREFSTTQGRQ